MNITIHLTDDQRTRLQQGEAIPITEPETQLNCVLVRSEAREGAAVATASGKTAIPYDLYGSCRR